MNKHIGKLKKRLYLVGFWQWRLSDLLIIESPHDGHVDEAPGADRAEEVTRLDEGVEAALVNEVVAGRNLRRLS